MITIAIALPSIFFSIITFPGIIIHELAYQFFCWVMRVPVVKVKYFQIENPCGYVISDKINSPMAKLVILAGSSICTNILGTALVFQSILSFGAFGFSNDIAQNLLTIFSIWLGVSIMVHSIPNKHEVANVSQSIFRNDEVSMQVKIFSAPIIGLMYLSRIGALYIVFVCIFLPMLVLAFV